MKQLLRNSHEYFHITNCYWYRKIAFYVPVFLDTSTILVIILEHKLRYALKLLF